MGRGIMQNGLFYGCATAMITPFSNGKVDFPALAALITRQLKLGTDAQVILGTTGEPSTLTHGERMEILECASALLSGRVPLIAGTGANSTSTAIKYSKEAQSLGADALLIVTPYYNKANARGLIEHYAAIADSVEIPIIVYNVPTRTGVNITPDIASELFKHPMIRGIKEAASDFRQITELARQCREGAAIYCGNDEYAYSMLALGARGVISVAANLVPERMLYITTNYLLGEREASASMQFELMPLINALFSDVNPIPVKAALAELGLVKEEYRLPLCAMDANKRSALIYEMRALGIGS